MTPEEVRGLAQQADHLVCDTNVLLTLVCTYGQVSPNDWKPARDRLVEAVLAEAWKANPSIVILPTVLTEASHFVKNAPPYLRWHLSLGLAAVADTYTETYTPTRTLVRDAAYVLLGLTDVDVVLQRRALVLSTDQAVVNERWARGLAAIDPHRVDI